MEASGSTSAALLLKVAIIQVDNAVNTVKIPGAIGGGFAGGFGGGYRGGLSGWIEQWISR